MQSKWFIILIFAVFSIGCGDSSPNEDAADSPSAPGSSAPSGSAFNGDVSAMQALADNKVVVAGDFTQHNNSVNVGRLALLDENGALDASFNTNLGAGFNGKINSVVQLSDGSFVVGGDFTEVNGNSANYIAKVAADGSVDTAFLTNIGIGFNASVNKVILNASGDLLVVGNFTLFNAVSSRRYQKLSPAGGVL